MLAARTVEQPSYSDDGVSSRGGVAFRQACVCRFWRCTNPKMLVHCHLAIALENAEDLTAFTQVGRPGYNADMDRALRKEMRRRATDGGHGDGRGGEVERGAIWRCKKSDAPTGFRHPGSRNAVTCMTRRPKRFDGNHLMSAHHIVARVHRSQTGEPNEEIKRSIAFV